MNINIISEIIGNISIVNYINNVIMFDFGDFLWIEFRLYVLYLIVVFFVLIVIVLLFVLVCIFD